jgi:hypothetical protein
MIMIGQGNSWDARVQESKSEGTQECRKAREEGIKSAGKQE